MIELASFAAQGRFLMAMAERHTADLDDSHRALEPAPGVKTAGWLIGHLAVTGDFGRRLCSREPLCPREWRAAFNPGTRPPAAASDYPAMASLRDALCAVYRDLIDAAPTVDPAVLAVQNPYAPAQGGFPTAGEFVGYLLTGHFAYHLGQLMLWRVASGVAPAANRERPA
jgi:hypothetical protein